MYSYRWIRFAWPDFLWWYQNYFAPISNFGQGRVFRVRSKPSKQPLGLVARGVPIEKVRAKRAMHSDWARGVAGAWSREAAPGEVQLQTRPWVLHTFEEERLRDKIIRKIIMSVKCWKHTAPAICIIIIYLGICWPVAGR